MKKFKSFSELSAALTPAQTPAQTKDNAMSAQTPRSRYTVEDIKDFFSAIEKEEIKAGYYARCTHAEEYSDGTLIFFGNLYRPRAGNLPEYWPDGAQVCALYTPYGSLYRTMAPRASALLWAEQWEESDGVTYVRTFDKMSQDFD